MNKKEPAQSKSHVIVTAPAGYGKTRFLLKELSEHLKSLEGDALFRPRRWIVTPYREQVRRLKDLLANQFHIPLVMANPILSFSELEALLLRTSRDLSEIKKRRILEQVIQGVDLVYYREALKNPGFVPCMSQFITEWKRLGLEDKDFVNVQHKIVHDPVFSLKLMELHNIYKAYEDRVSELKRFDFDDAFLDSISKKREIPEGLSGVESLSFDGFYDFSWDQIRLLEYLKRIIPEIRIFLTHEEHRRGKLFELTQGTIEKLEAAGFQSIETDWFTQNHRTRSKSLLHVERNIFSDEKRELIDSPADIGILQGIGIRGEVALIAREILALRKGTPDLDWCDIALLLRKVNEYEPYLHEVFQEYGIPYEIHERHKLGENPWARHLLEGLEILRDDLKDPRALFDFLKSSYLVMSKKTVLDFERFAEGNRFWKSVAELDSLVAAWVELCSDDSEVKLLKDFLDRLKKMKAALDERSSARDFEEMVLGCFTQWGNIRPEPASISGRRLGEDLKAQEQIARILKEIRINERETGERLSYNECLVQLERGVKLALFSVHRKILDVIQVYSVQMSRQKEFRIVFMGGLLQKNFPEPMREDPVLKDDERGVLSELGFELRLERASHERYYFYTAVTRATERLYLSYPHYDLDGKGSLRSFFIDEVCSLFRKPEGLMSSIPVIAREEDAWFLEPHKAVLRHDLKNRLACELGRLMTAEEAKEKQAWIDELYQFLETKGEMHDLDLPDPARGKDVHLSLAQKKKVKTGNEKPFSPTGLETYRQCPIRYYFSKILRLREPDEIEFVPANKEGELYHKCLEIVFQEIFVMAKPFSTTRIEEVAREQLEIFLKTFRLKPYEEKVYREDFIRRLSLFVSRELKNIEESGFKPIKVEQAFGPGSNLETLVLKAGNVTFSVQGKIDRVDADASQEKAVVTDYKTGRSAKLEREALERGFHLQLPLYARAVREKLGLEPVRIRILSIKRAEATACDEKKIETMEETLKHRGIQGSAMKALEELAIQYAGECVKGIRDQVFPVEPHDCPEYCPFPGVCRYELWRRNYLKGTGGD